MTPETDQKAADRITAFTWWNSLTATEKNGYKRKNPGVYKRAEIEQLWREQTQKEANDSTKPEQQANSINQ